MQQCYGNVKMHSSSLLFVSQLNLASRIIRQRPLSVQKSLALRCRSFGVNPYICREIVLNPSRRGVCYGLLSQTLLWTLLFLLFAHCAVTVSSLCRKHCSGHCNCSFLRLCNEFFFSVASIALDAPLLRCAYRHSSSLRGAHCPLIDFAIFYSSGPVECGSGAVKLNSANALKSGERQECKVVALFFPSATVVSLS